MNVYDVIISAFTLKVFQASKMNIAGLAGMEFPPTIVQVYYLILRFVILNEHIF